MKTARTIEAAAPSGAGTRPGSTPVSLAVFITTLSLAVCATGMAYHEMWRDEAFTWLLMGAVPSAGHMWAEIQSNGHPLSWYMLIYALTRITGSLATMELLNLFAAAAAVYTVARFAPFSTSQKALFALGFYPVYQYGVVLRPYGLMLLLLLCFCALRGSRRDRPWALALCLSGFAMLHALSVVIASVLWASEAHRRSRGGSALPSLPVVAGLAVSAVAILGTALQLWLAREGAGSPFGGGDPSALLYSFSSAFLPDFGVLSARPFRAAGVLLGAGSFVYLARRPTGLGFAYYLASTFLLGFFFAAIYVGFRWHHGFLFVLFVVALWLQRDTDGDEMDGRLRRVLERVFPIHHVTLRRIGGSFPTLLFAVHAAVGLYATGYDVLAPMSSGESAAGYIRAQGLETLPRVGLWLQDPPQGAREPESFRFDVDHAQATLVHLTEGEIFEPRAGKMVRYWKHYDDVEYFPVLPLARLDLELDSVCRDLRSDLLLIVSRPPALEVAQLPGKARKLRDLPSVPPHGESVSLFSYPCGGERVQAADAGAASGGRKATP